jgi:hypothetical protein
VCVCGGGRSDKSPCPASTLLLLLLLLLLQQEETPLL